MPSDNDIMEVTTVVRTVNAQNQLNIFNVKVVGTVDLGATMTECAAELSSQLGPFMKSIIPATSVYQGCRVRQVAPGVSQIVASDNSNGEGTLALEPLPDHVTCLVSLRNPDAPIRIRGRIYLPSPSEGENDATGKPSGTYRGAILSALGPLYADPIVAEGIGGDTTMRLGIFAPSAEDLFFYVENVIVRQQWTSQRRRRPISRPDQPLF